LIDLNAMSARVDEALGDPLVQRAYVGAAYQHVMAAICCRACIVEGIRQNKLGLVKYLVEDAGRFDPAHPVPLPDDFKIRSSRALRGRDAAAAPVRRVVAEFYFGAE